jgi:hypothetical protein
MPIGYHSTSPRSILWEVCSWEDDFYLHPGMGDRLKPIPPMGMHTLVGIGL